MWQFSSDFADTQRDRVDRLTAWRSYSEIVDAVIAMSTIAPDLVIWMPRKTNPREAHRIESNLGAAPVICQSTARLAQLLPVPYSANCMASSAVR